ncbi:MAG: flagellar hook protein [Lachnospiraceae bacterium]|nr:flagellar hook protein [Lachnospiraceae bacterium]
MVVQHNLQAMNANRMLGITTGQQSKSTEKLSSGYKINRAADDAAGLTISEKMRKQIRGLDRASTNAEDGISCVQTAEGALTEVHSMLQRMNELAVQAANGTMSEDDRQAVQDEIDQLVTEIDRVSETTKFNEIYLLKGKEGTEKTETVATYKFELTQIAKDAQKGTLGLTAAGQNALFGAGQTTAITGATAAAGASMALDTATLGTNKLFVSPTGATVAAGTDFVEVTDADLATYFDVADDGTVTAKAGVSFATAANATLVNAGGGTASNGTDVVIGTPATQATTSDIEKYVEVAEDGSLKYKDGQMLYNTAADATDEYGDQLEATQIAEADLSTYIESNANPLVDSTGAKIDDVSAYFENGVYKGGIFRNDTNGNSVEIGAEQIKDYIDVKENKVEIKTAEALEFNLHVGSESDTSNKIKVEIKSMSAGNIGVAKLKGTGLMTEDDATNAIDTIADAISMVSKQRSALGAVQNRLEHTIANLDNVVENTTAAESRIRDVDMAEEMVEYSKNNILAQAGQSMLAQANQSTQGVLSLLG